MDDNTPDVESTEVIVDREPAELSIRQSLSKQFKNLKEEESVEEPNNERSTESAVVQQSVPQTQERIALAPPADMNATEKDAFLNPNTDNAHILQSYLNRRAYETRTQYDRKMQEVNQLREQNSRVYDVIKEYENDYAKDGISVADVTRRSVAWDRAMQANPVQTAIEWLEAYGLNPNDLVGQQEAYQQPTEYLTRQDAERIAEERYKSIQEEQEKKAVEYMNQRAVESFTSRKPLFRDPETASQLEAEMAPVVQALATTGRYSSTDEILETAYNYVVNGNPTFASLAQRLQTAPVIQQQQVATQKAKAASKSISGSAGSGTPRIVTKDIRDNLRRRLSGD
jgi:hypothetical protein